MARREHSKGRLGNLPLLDFQPQLPPRHAADPAPELTFFGATALALSVAAYFVLLDNFISHSLFEVPTAVGILLLLAIVAGQATMLLSFGHDDDSPLVNAVLAGSLAVLALVVVLGIVSITGTHIGDKIYGTLAVLYLLGALLPPFLRWEEAEGT